MLAHVKVCVCLFTVNKDKDSKLHIYLNIPKYLVKIP
jgi:hypothetical protein